MTSLEMFAVLVSAMVLAQVDVCDSLNTDWYWDSAAAAEQQSESGPGTSARGAPTPPATCRLTLVMNIVKCICLT